MAVFLRAYDRNGTALGLMPDFTDLQVQTTDNSPGAMTFKYLRDGLNAAFLDRDELFLATVEDGVESPDLFQLEEDTDDEASTLTQTKRRWITVAARGYMGVLDQAVVYPAGANAAASNLYGLKPEYTFKQATPGQIMWTFIANAKGRGALNELIVSWGNTTDSANRAWPTKHDITYPAGTNYLQVLNNMIEDGWVDARTYGRTLQLFVPDTYFGVKSDVLRYGQNVLSAPRKRSRRGIFSHVLAAGDAEKKATVQVANTTTASRFGRREGFASDGNRKTTAALAWMGNIELNKHQQLKEGFTLEMVMNPPGPGEYWPRPGIDFFCGDRIYYDRYTDGAGNYIQLIVRSITKSWGDTTKQPTASIELADLFMKQSARTAAQVSAITNGSTGVRAPAPRAPERDTFPPISPTSVTVTGQTDLFPEGTRKVYRSKATVTWPFVNQDSDGTPLEDLDCYEVQTSVNGGPWSASKVSKDTQELIEGLKPLDLVRARVLAKDWSGNRSDWTLSDSVQMPMDLTAPLVPTAPVLTQKLGNVTARWDGLGLPGPAAMPDDFDHVVLERCLTTAFTSGVITVDRLYLPDATTIITGLPYSQTWYFRFVAVDVQGNRSMASTVASIAVTPLVNADLPAKVISDIDQAIADANAAGTAAAAAQATANAAATQTEFDAAVSDLNSSIGTVDQKAIDAKAVADAAATQTAFDGALTRLTTTEGVASAAKTKADLAAPQATVDNLLADLDTNYYTKPETNSYVQQSVATKSQVIYSTSNPSGTAYNNGDIWRKVDTLANGGKILGEWTFTMPGAAWVTRVYSGAVLTALDAGSITAGFLDAARINAGALSIGQVSGLGTSLTNAQTAADGVDATNLNPSFSQWPDGQAAPTNWIFYVSNGVRESALARTQPYAARFTCPDTTTAYGIYTTSTGGLAPLPFGTEYVTLTIDLMLNSGASLNGAGVLFDWTTTGFTSNDFRAFWKFADDIPAPVAGKWYRLTRVLRRPTKIAGGVQTGWQLYVMANYSSGLNAMTVKDLIVNRVAARPSTVSEVTAYNAAPSSTVTALSLRGADLVTNGSGQTKDNTNFSTFTWNADAPPGAAGSFLAPSVYQRTETTDELIAVDAAKKYRVSGWIKNLGTAPSTFYFRVWFCDITGQPMGRQNNCTRTGSEATLAAPLNPGDTTMKITGGIASWQDAVAKNEAYYQRYINFYDYVDGNGRAWPAYTFTKSQIGPSGTTPAFSAVAADGTVTLAVPYAGTAKPAGLEVAIGQGGDTSTYSWVAGGTVPSVWTNYVGTLAGMQSGNAAINGQFPYGTAYLKIAFLHHYMAGTDAPNHKPAVTFSVSEAAYAAALAESVDTLTTGWKFTGKTTINGGVIEADTIRVAQLAAGSVGARQLIVADTANMAEVNESAAGAVTYGGWTHVLEVASGVRWSRRDITTNTYFMFRNQTGPLPFKTGDRIRLTFEAFADAAVAATPTLWLYGGGADTSVGFSAAPTPEGGTAWPTQITTSVQSFAFEVVAPAVTVQTSYLVGLYGLSARDVRVRNVRIYRMGAGELIVDGSITAKQIKANTITVNELATNVLTIGNVSGLATRTDLVDGWRITGKTTINGGQIEADTVTSAQVKANSIGAKHLAVGDMSNMCELNEQVTGNISFNGWTNVLETVSGAPWSKRDVTSDQYFFFRNKVGPLPYKTGDRIRLTFEAFADATVAAAPQLYTYGAVMLTNTFSVAPTPSGGTAWPNQITTSPQSFAFEVTVGAITDHSTFLIGLPGIAGRNVRVRNVRAYRMGAGELIVDGSIEGKAIKANTITATQIDATTLTIGQSQVPNLSTDLASKLGLISTSSSSKIFRNVLQTVALAGQGGTGTVVIKTPVTAGNYMTRLSVRGYQYDTMGELDLDIAFYAYSSGSILSASFRNSGTFAVTARYGKDANGKVVILLDPPAGKTWNYTRIEIPEAAIGQTTPPDSFATGWSAALETDLTPYTGLVTPLMLDLASGTRLVDGWKVTGKTTINGGVIETDSVTAAAIKANQIGAKHLAVGDMSNMAELNEQVAGNVSFSGTKNILETVSGAPWSKRDVITGQYFMFRNQYGPLPFKAGDRIRLTFEAFADATVTPTPYLWTYGPSTAPYAAFAAAPTPAGGSAWPTVITTAAQQFAYEVVVPALTDQTSYLIGLGGLTSRDVRVRNVRAYRMGAGELIVDGTIEGKHIKAGTVDADRIIASTLTIGKVQDLSNQLSQKETPSGAQTKATQAKTDAITAAADAAATTYGPTKTLVNGWSLSGKTTINGGAIEADTLSVAAIKAGSIGVSKLAVADTANMATIDAEPATAAYGGMTHATITGIDGRTDWIARSGTKNTYFMFRPQVGPVPVKAGDRVRLTFTGYLASGTSNVTALMWFYGGSGAGTNFQLVPVAGSPTQFTSAIQQFTLEGVVPATVTDHTSFLIGLTQPEFTTLDPRVRNVRAYRMGAGELLVDGSIEAKHIKANSITADAIAVGSISVDKIQQGVLRTNMIGDPSFEENYAFTSITDAGQGATWQWRKATSGTGAVMQRVVGKARSGTRRLTIGTDGTGGVATTSTAYSPTFTVEAGKTYRVTWYAVATGAGATGANTAKLTVEAVFGPSATALNTAAPMAVSEGVTTVPYAADVDITPDLFAADSGDLIIPAGQTNLFAAIRLVATNNAADCSIYIDDISTIEVGIGGASELTAAGLRLFDDDGDEATALVTNRPNYFTVTKDGVNLAAIGGDGNADFKRVGVVDDIDIAGAPAFSGWKDAFGNRTFGTSWESAAPMLRDFTAKPVGMVESMSGGVVGHVATTPSNSTLTAAGAYQMINRVAADLEMGRFYSVRTSPFLAIIPSGVVAALILRWTTDGTDPTPTSQILARDYKTGNGSYESFQIADRPIAGSANQRDIRIMAQFTYLSGTGTITPVQDLFLMTVYDEGYQPDPGTGTNIATTVGAGGTGTQPTTKKSYTSTWKANNSQTRRGTSSYGTNTINTAAGSGKVLSGYYSSSNGIQHAYLEFTNASSTGSETGKTISQALTGATVKKVEVYVKNASFYSSSGGKMKFSMTTLGAVSGASTLAPPTTSFTGDQTFTVGQGKWVTLPNESLTTLKNGGRVVCLYPGNTTSRTYYSGWVNHQLTNGQPLLRVTYER